MKHPKPTFGHERELWNRGVTAVCGVDEVGRGAFAGPVVAGAVIFPPNITFSDKALSDIHDSKLLSQKKRTVLAEAIKKEALCYGVAEVDIATINTIGIGKASQLALQKAVSSLTTVPDFCLVDAFYINTLPQSKQKPLVGGDRISISIAAASIVAKVYRDLLMVKLHETYSIYNFKENKGYGTVFHRQMLQKHGISPVHRTSFNLGLSL